ncbi:MAG TPA: methyltransferase domain-containing protein [Actinomycetota bacterium]|jgi:2-polyprenyl-3-methyl-5-hydroxy-6-metoxy-1,4-benzoquinol methylase
MSDSPVSVVFIGGYARTGSTLLDRLLGQIEGFESFGEVRHVWDRGFLGNQLCGCGKAFRECPFWREVVDAAFGGFGGIDPLEISRIRASVDGFRDIPRILTGGWTPSYRRRMDAYRKALGRLYGGMQRVSGAKYLVDSTKDPQHAYILRSIPGFDVRFVHLVRDSRPVAFSWQRLRRRPEVVWESRYMPRYRAVRSGLAWDFSNVAAAATRRFGFPYVLVRYEDLVRDTRAELTRILDALELGPDRLAFLGPSTAHLEGAHTVAGNPMRFHAGGIEIRQDEEWVKQMRPLQRAVVTTLTWPLLARYGYVGGRTEDVASNAPAPPCLASGNEDPGRRGKGSIRSGPSPAEMWTTLLLALAHRQDPLSFGRAVAILTRRYLKARGVPIAGCRWLDVGAGSGTLAEALAAAGANVVALDLSDRRVRGTEPTPFVVGTAQRLPFRGGSFDGVASSNVLEHVEDTWGLIDELLRVCSPGGLVYLSWTNWYSPFGGHDWSPFHYLGQRFGLRVYRMLFRRAPLHVPGRTLFPVHVGDVIRGLGRRDVRLLDACPRYWPSLRFLAKIPGVREVTLWNCVVLVQKRARPAEM